MCISGRVNRVWAIRALCLTLVFYIVGYVMRMSSDVGGVQSRSLLKTRDFQKAKLENVGTSSITIRTVATTKKQDLLECRSDFSAPYNTTTTLDLAERTYFDDLIDGQYVLPHKPVNEAAYSDNLEPLTVIIMPFTHVDPGWLQTLDEYYMFSVRNILDGMVRKLVFYPELTFIWAEIVFFSMWWNEQNKEIKQNVRDLVKQGRLEFVSGGWVMPDEASTSYTSVIDQQTEGHQWLLDNVGVTPSNSWSVDPFGHSGTMPYIWKLAGMKNMVINRIHQGTKAQMIRENGLDFYWRQFWTQDADIFCHCMPYEVYSLKSNCGPDRKICERFDFQHVEGVFYEKINPEIDNINVVNLSRLLYEQYRMKSSLFKHNTVLVPLGDDFRYDHMNEWDQQYVNYKKLMEYMNSKPEWKIHVKFGTLNDFLNTVHKHSDTSKFPIISGDFFPYSDRKAGYWTGYFTTRVFDKTFSRDVESRLRAAEIMHSFASTYSKHWNRKYAGLVSLARQLTSARQNYGLFLHHDAITGTERQNVAMDYEQRLFSAYNIAGKVLTEATHFVLSRGKNSGPSNMKFLTSRKDSIHLAQHNLVKLFEKESTIVIYNPTGQFRSEFVGITFDQYAIEIIDSKNRSLVYQLNPVFSNNEKVSKSLVEVWFLTEIAPFGVETYTVRKTSRPHKGQWASISVRNMKNLVLPSKLKFKFKPELSVDGMPISIQNEHMAAYFNENYGFLNRVKQLSGGDETGIDIDLSFVQYTSSASGAYTFVPDGPAIPFISTVPNIRIIEGPYLSEVQVVCPTIYHRIKLYKHKGLVGTQLHIDNTLDMASHDMASREVAMRLQTSIQNEKGTFFTDQNGFQYIRRKRHPSDKIRQHIERNFYPLTTMAFMQDDLRRLTLHSAQPHGVASLESGWLEVMLDRHIFFGDGRGMDDPVIDNKITETSFILQLEYSEKPLSDEYYSFPSLDSTVMNGFLNKPLQRMFTTMSLTGFGSNFQPVKSDLPCGISLESAKVLYNYVSGAVKGIGLILHRHGFRCSFRSKSDCEYTNLNLETLLPDTNNLDIKETTINFVQEKSSSRYLTLSSIEMKPMEIKAFFVQDTPLNKHLNKTILH
ncbi:alpha-mannosidase 2-like isoform X2 [Mya arenaria]|uniref:alpha-mannosidase 2-like isoform X2 n=1 Tax=Mya arenaria TaxID=6604 RepID=UPI0022E1A97C|nr:alpha-mannosidase 2-like isoform X2 [Mya arenaria]